MRYFNASGAAADGSIGEDHTPETHLIPLVIYAAMGKRPQIEVFGTDYSTPDGTCIRDYIHVHDLANAHIAALKHLLAGGASDVFNVGTGQGCSVKEVLAAVERVTGRRVPHVIGLRREGDPARLVADSAKLRRTLGWEPAHSSLDQIIRDAWEFETAWHNTSTSR